MNKHPELVVMLTHNDQTVENAYDIFSQCKDTPPQFWGMKEKGLSDKKTQELFAYMKECGKTTVLEVVAYTEQECLAGAKKACEFGCDILMGTLFFDSVNDFCREHNLKYMPFVGAVSGRPSVLDGTFDSMLTEAKSLLKKGVYGFDLLGYRYTGNAPMLIHEFISRIDAPVCLAGSINSFTRLDEVKKAKPWTFTIGGAFFDNKFNGTFSEQINKVYSYINSI